MARPLRSLQSNVVYHVYNRRTDKQCLFPTAEGYADLLSVLRRASQRYQTRLHAYCLLHTHIHLALSAEKPKELVECVRWIATTHAVRFRLKTETRGHGHVYGDRYKSKAAPDAVHYATLIRYIERNPVEAGVVARAEDWQWSSLRERLSGNRQLIEAGPWTLPSDWVDIVNAADVKMYELAELLGQVSTFVRAPRAFREFK